MAIARIVWHLNNTICLTVFPTGYLKAFLAQFTVLPRDKFTMHHLNELNEFRIDEPMSNPCPVSAQSKLPLAILNTRSHQMLTFESYKQRGSLHPGDVYHNHFLIMYHQCHWITQLSIRPCRLDGRTWLGTAALAKYSTRPFCLGFVNILGQSLCRTSGGWLSIASRNEYPTV
jgi:hypothetical protein